MLKKRLLMACIALGLAVSASAGVRDHAVGYKQDVQFELGGPTNLLGVSYERRIKDLEMLGVRVGLAWGFSSDDEVFGSYYDAKLNTVTVPVDVNVLLGRRAKHKFEGALGVNLGCYHERFKLQGGGIKVEGDQTNFGTFFYTNLGYRFCSKKGLLVRVGMTFNTDFIEGPELFEKRNFAPYFGIGYAF